MSDQPVLMFSMVVNGKPEPAGSKQAFVPTDKQGNPFRTRTGRIIVNVVDDNPKAKAWKTTIAAAARKLHRASPVDGPLVVTFRFYVARLLSHFGTGRNANVLKATAPRWPIVRPDVLKFARAAEDALSEIVWRDDAQIVEEHLYKFYDTQPRVEIDVWQLAAGQLTLFTPESLGLLNAAEGR